jgi:hypothetical protein
MRCSALTLSPVALLLPKKRGSPPRAHATGREPEEITEPIDLFVFERS